MTVAIRKRLKRHWKPIALIAEVMLFAFAYQLIWIARPDYFRVQSDVNFLPLDLVEQAQGFRDDSGRSLPIVVNPDTRAAAERIRTVYDNMQRAVTDLRGLRTAFARREAQDRTAYKSFEASEWAQVDRYIHARTDPFQKQIDVQEVRKATILAAGRAKREDDLPSGVLAIGYADANLVESKVREQELGAEIEARKYALAHLTEFQRLPAQAAYLAFNHETDALRDQLYKRQNQRWALDGQLYDAMVNYRSVARPPLGYFDFLYFSIGGATTANSADIAPNNTLVRMLFSLQIIASVILVGLWINDLAKRASARRADR